MNETNGMILGAVIAVVVAAVPALIQSFVVPRRKKAAKLAEEFASLYELEALYLEEIENLKAGKESFVKSDKATQIKIDMRAINEKKGNLPIEFTAKTAKTFAKQMKFFF